ncbi:hypothetical protein MLD63_01045 (plasmid) [Paracoccus sp. TK19116]|uniref:Secreted protein n=1 Tax=Paracoccus albicereus TaxID=2922394 RepID=A0ABT1MN47_9RHOB|nr:hypothetical protein [Paracoccus albicereus]MCQ0969021.1 hypothetical protein [Paracoccus albicereus]
MTRDLFNPSITALAVALALSSPAIAQDAAATSPDAAMSGADAEPAETSEQAAQTGETEPPLADNAANTPASEVAGTSDTGTEMTDTADAGAIDPATCPALAVIEDERSKIERVLKLVTDDLAQPSNLNTAYQGLQNAIAESLSDADYDPDCYKATIEAVQPLSTDEISGVQSTALSMPVVNVWADQCGEMTDADGIFVCLQNTGDAIGEGLLTDAQAITLVNALPLENVEMDDNQVDSLLMAVKEQVEAGHLSKNTQSQIVNRVLGQ